MPPDSSKVYDYVIVGSGFGGSVSAMRLAEKGYSVLVLERGRRYQDGDFPKTNWNLRRYLWLPFLRCFGFMQFSLYKHLMAVHGDGVGGGSLVYGNVLLRPDEKIFSDPAWSQLQDWKSILLPHYTTAERMLGVVDNPRRWPADDVVQQIAVEFGVADTFHPTRVGVFFGDDPSRDDGQAVPDPYFAGQGPARNACIHCGGCMVGCRYNAKNTLTKNYLYFAEKWGAQVMPCAWVTDVVPLPPNQPDQARYDVVYHSTTAGLFKRHHRIRARNVVFSAGTLGTLELLLRCRDVTRSLPDLSPRLGETVRTNSEALLGATSHTKAIDYSKGIAITSIFQADDDTAIEPVRYSAGSSLIRLFSAPVVNPTRSFLIRLFAILWQYLTHPMDFLRTYFFPGWAQATTVLVAMQTRNNYLRMRIGRSWLTLLRRGLVTEAASDHPIPARIESGHRVLNEFVRKIGGTAASSFFEVLFKIPVTAHILGGVPLGHDDQDGVVGLDCQIHHYPGLYVVDGSIMPANPGVNPSLTITALAEYAMSKIPPKTRHAKSPLELVSPHHQQSVGSVEQLDQ